MAVAFGLNRLEMTSPAAFAESAARAESLGWQYGFIPSSPLLVQDPYVMLAEALRRTEAIKLGPLIENPIMRHPAVIAGSIATVDRIAPGRTLIGLGVGDTAVRLMGRSPARVKTLESAADLIGLLRVFPAALRALWCRLGRPRRGVVEGPGVAGLSSCARPLRERARSGFPVASGRGRILPSRECGRREGPARVGAGSGVSA